MQKMLIIHLHFEVGQSVMHFLLPVQFDALLHLFIWQTGKNYVNLTWCNLMRICELYSIQLKKLWPLQWKLQVLFDAESPPNWQQWYEVHLIGKKNAPKRIIWIKHLMYSVSPMIFLQFDYLVFFSDSRVPPMHSIPNRTRPTQNYLVFW